MLTLGTGLILVSVAVAALYGFVTGVQHIEDNRDVAFKIAVWGVVAGTVVIALHYITGV